MNSWTMWITAMLIGICLFQGSDGTAPSYVSGWLWMDVNDYTSTDVTLNHNFGVRPVKADVQVRSQNTGFIYPGVRSAHAENDDGKRGGVICLYGINTVRLLGATNENSDSSDRAYIIYTGSTTWTSQNWEALEAAWVRVRLWNPADLPAPSHTISTSMAAEGSHSLPMYLELAHNLGTQPSLTVVQYYSTDTSSYFYNVVAEAQGTNAVKLEEHDGDLDESSFVFGVNSSHIRLWAFNSDGGVHYGMFSFCKGWGYYTDTTSDCKFDEAHVNISFWRDIDYDVSDTQTVSHTVTDSSSHEYTITSFDAATDLITVTSSPTNGVNSGFEFDGTGAAMSDAKENGAGLIYAYNEDGRVRLWHPLSPYCIVQVGPGMGEDINNQCAQEVQVTINVWHAGCSVTEVENGVATGTVNFVTYTCNGGYVHTSGDLQRSCQDDNTWNGTLPVCQKCADLEIGSMATLDIHLLIAQSIANFTCVDGYNLVSGNLTRYCVFPNATWSGAPPICEAPSTTAPSTTTTTVATPTPTSSVTPTTTSSTTPTTTATTTSGTTTAPSSVEVCYNVTNVVYNTTTLTEITEEIIANLTVDVKSTSKFERSKTSAQDSRSSSMYIGLTGYLIFGLIGAVVLIPDFVNVVRYLFCRSDEERRV